MRFTLLQMVLVCGCLISAPAGLHAQEWSRFRGPNGDGRSDAKTIPTEWTQADENWRIELPGVGHSSPVLWGDKIFLMSSIQKTAERIVLCIDATTGKTRWERRFPSSVHTKHLKNSYGSCTPAADAKRVYVSWTAPEEYTLLALDHEGNEVWRRNLGPYAGEHSGATSPIVYEDMVVINNDQDGESSLIAVEAATGSTRWETPRKSEKVAYSTPCVFDRPGSGPELIFNSGAHGMTGVEPRTGRVKWDLDIFTMRTVSSPVIAGDLLLGTTGSGGGGNYVAALRVGPGGPEVAYKVEQSAPYVPTPVVCGDNVFLWGDNGVVACVEATTGKAKWRNRVGGNYSGSPVCVDGRVFCISEDGMVMVIAAKDKFELLAKNPLGESSYSTPAIAGGKMYLRTFSHLISVGGK